jgi:hypothetical protein
MSINKALLALALGFVLAVSASANSQSTSQPMTREQALSVLQNSSGQVALPRRPSQNPYVRERVKVGENRSVIIFEDHKRNRLCYISHHDLYNDPDPISCGPLFPK